MVLLDHFANEKQHSLPLSFSPFLLSLPLSLSCFLPFPPWVTTSSDPGSQDRAINGTLGKTEQNFCGDCNMYTKKSANSQQNSQNRPKFRVLCVKKGTGLKKYTTTGGGRKTIYNQISSYQSWMLLVREWQSESPWRRAERQGYIRANTTKERMALQEGRAVARWPQNAIRATWG